MLNLRIKKFFILSVGAVIFWGFSPVVLADGGSRIYFDSPVSVVSPQSKVPVSIFLDTTTAVNALDLEITYPADQLELLDSDNAGSIVDFWQNNTNPSEKGKLELSGGILQSFSGKAGLVLKLNFKVLGSDSANLVFSKSDLFLADGRGTKVSANSTPFIFTVSRGANKLPITTTSIQDTTVPDIFMELSMDPASHAKLIVFSATDRGSGIRTTEMRIKKWWSWSDWHKVQNPVLYPNGIWGIELRVTNNAGLTNTKTLFLFGNFFLRVLLPILLFIVFVIYLIVRYNKRK